MEDVKEAAKLPVEVCTIHAAEHTGLSASVMGGYCPPRC